VYVIGTVAFGDIGCYLSAIVPLFSYLCGASLLGCYFDPWRQVGWLVVILFIVVVHAPVEGLVESVSPESGYGFELCLGSKGYLVLSGLVGAILLLQGAWAHALMVMGWVMLGEVVSEVVCTFLPAYFELFLCIAVSDPVEVHVDCLGSFLLDSIVGNALCAFVIGYHDGGRLGVS
jgi:hypothetical protein